MVLPVGFMLRRLALDKDRSKQFRLAILVELLRHPFVALAQSLSQRTVLQ